MNTEKLIDVQKNNESPNNAETLARIPSAGEYIKSLEQNGCPEQAEAYGTVIKICEAVKNRGGRALLVGGSVRDMAMGKISKDFDLEIYGSDVGKAFGILKMSLGNGIDIDVSLPRTDSKIGEGRRGFEVKTNPHISITDAAKRRNFTMNSMAVDPLSGEIFDPLSSPRCGNQVKLAQNREKYFFRLVL